MLKKCAILGFAVLLVGGLALGWLFKETRSEQERMSRLRAKYTGSEDYLKKYDRWHLLSPDEQTRLVLELNKERQGKSGQQLAEEQEARRSVDIEKLAGGQVTSGEIANLVYGSGWEQEVSKYKKLQEQKEIAHTASVVCISIGGTILSGCLIAWVLYGMARLVRGIRGRRSRRIIDETPVSPQISELTEIPAESPDEVPSIPATESRSKSRSLSPISPSGNEPEAAPRGSQDDGFLPRTLGSYGASRRATLMVRKPTEDQGDKDKKAQEEEEASPTNVLMSDEVVDQEWSPNMQWSAKATPTASDDDIVQAPRLGHQVGAAAAGDEKPSVAAPNVLKEQAEDLQKQLAEFKQVAQSVQQATQGQSEPITSTLKELAQQVSAIRDYAASQQNRVEKLQDGYDWTIIRTFCLRVIRCIDNIEKRMQDLGEDDQATPHLEEIRDELVFAMESSGVEKFEPELNTDFHGQEKSAEAIKDKEACNKPDLAGKIAKVLRSGYRYIIDDENYKVVRTAQVKLFG